MRLIWIILPWAMLTAGIAGPSAKGEESWKLYRSTKFGYELSYPAAMEFKEYFEGSSGDLIDRRSGRVLVYFEVWPADTCPRQPAGTTAREIGIERAKAISQADGPDGSSYCGDPITVREQSSLYGAKIYELELTCMSETYPFSLDDDEDAEPGMEEIDADPVVKYEGKKGPTYFVDISQSWRRRILIADPAGSNPLKSETENKADPAILKKILESLKTFRVEKPEGICIENLQNRGPLIGAKPESETKQISNYLYRSPNPSRR
jgi:hypothetical protein